MSHFDRGEYRLGGVEKSEYAAESCVTLFFLQFFQTICQDHKGFDLQKKGPDPCFQAC